MVGFFGILNKKIMELMKCLRDIIYLYQMMILTVWVE